MVNRFTLARYTLSEPTDNPLVPTDLAVPVIDGVPLFEIVGDRLPGVAVALLAAPSRQWLGEPSYLAYGRTVVLDGDCGDAECCGVTARIDFNSSTVTWSDFQTHGWPPLPDGLRFTFNRSQYEREIERLLDVEPTPWTDPQ
jgi:hypothetical protein